MIKIKNEYSHNLLAVLCIVSYFMFRKAISKSVRVTVVLYLRRFYKGITSDKIYVIYVD